VQWVEGKSTVLHQSLFVKWQNEKEEKDNMTSLNPMPNAQVCVHLTVHIIKLQLKTTCPKPLYIRHSICIYWDPGR